ncbi:MAG TPA: ferrochelatase [Burkholderiales bacterium]|nr:ferrochelatase [Burkholderiales bacterium]
MPFLPEPKHQHGAIARTGILLVNLGTPAAPTAEALRPYLREFLSDPRVVEIPRALWWPILNGVILRMRPRQSAAKYAQIWTKEGSPLAVHTAKQATLLRGYLGERIKSPHVVAWAMRYGQPSIESALRYLREQGCDRILVLPLYPQYAAATTASTYDAVFDAVKKMRNAPALRLVKHFHDHPAYIAALAKSVNDHWVANGRPDKLLMSFHGLPRFALDKGDPYHCECQKTARLLAAEVGLEPDQYVVTFQSRFGRAEWLKPYTMKTVEELGKRKTGRLDVICPGFVSDCLETLEEIGIENKAAYVAAGGKGFEYIACMNESHAWIQALARIAAENLHGWVSTEWDGAAAAREAGASRDRAAALGAKE